MLKNLKTYQLALAFHKECTKLKLRRALKDQLERASMSVALNIAEGSAKHSTKDRGRFYEIALASLRESQACLDIIEHVQLKNQADVLGAFLCKLRMSCKT